MADNIKTTLEDYTKEVLSEEARSEIEQNFMAAVEKKAQLHTEAALVQQDEEHAAKVQKLLEAIDTDHTQKLEKIVQAIHHNHAHKLRQVVEKFQGETNQEAGKFKTQLVESISNYLDLYLEKTFPAEKLDEAVKYKRADNALHEVRKLLAVDLAFSKDTIKDAIVDGKTQINEAATQLETVSKENQDLRSKLERAEAANVLNDLSAKLPEDKKMYVSRVLGNKDAQFITENFDYTVRLFDKEKSKHLEKITEEATTQVKGNVDPIVEEQAEVPSEAPVSNDADPMFNSYMGELGKY